MEKKFKRHRIEEVTQSLLCMGHAYLCYSYLLKKENQPMCTICQAVLKVKHILTECTLLVAVRHNNYSIENFIKKLEESIGINIIISYHKAILATRQIVVLWNIKKRVKHMSGREY